MPKNIGAKLRKMISVLFFTLTTIFIQPIHSKELIQITKIDTTTNFFLIEAINNQTNDSIIIISPKLNSENIPPHPYYPRKYKWLKKYKKINVGQSYLIDVKRLYPRESLPDHGIGIYRFDERKIYVYGPGFLELPFITPQIKGGCIQVKQLSFKKFFFKQKCP